MAFIDILLFYFFKINFFGDMIINWVKIEGEQTFLQNELGKLLNFVLGETIRFVLKKHGNHVYKTD